MKAKTTTVFSIRFTLNGKIIELKTLFWKWIKHNYRSCYVYIAIAGNAAEGDLLTNVSEELRERDIKQSPGTGK